MTTQWSKFKLLDANICETQHIRTAEIQTYVVMCDMWYSLVMGTFSGSVANAKLHYTKEGGQKI